MNLAEGAAAWRDLAARAQSELAVTACEEAAKDYLAILRFVTPKRSGALAASEKIDSLSGGGTHAVAVVAPHKVYAGIIESGGTVTRHAMRPHVLGSYGGPYYGHGNPARVHITGRHYMEKAAGASRGAIQTACLTAADRFFTL